MGKLKLDGNAADVWGTKRKTDWERSSSDSGAVKYKKKWEEIGVWLAPRIHYSALNIHWLFVNRDTTMPFPILRQ